MKTVNQEQVSNTEYSNKNTDTTENINNTCEESEFNRETITQLGNRVRLTDSGDGLELFCYVNCSSDDDTKLQQCRGVVFHENEVVMKAFPYTIEYGHNEFEQIDKNINSVFDKCSFYDAYEGNLVRIFHFNNK